MAASIYSAQTPDNHRAVSEQNRGIQVILQLDARERVRTASRWGIYHLLAYRLLTTEDGGMLQVFKVDHDAHCPACAGPACADPVCGDSHFCSQKLDEMWTNVLINGKPGDLHEKPESEILQLPGGFFWAALAQATRLQPADPAKIYPQRTRNPVERQGYISSAVAIPGSSSPLRSSSSEFEVDKSNLDEDEHDGR